MRPLPILLAPLFLLACQPAPEITPEPMPATTAASLGAADFPLRVPAVNVPSGQPVVPRRHVGDLVMTEYTITPDSAHVLAGDGCVSTSTDYWQIEFGAINDGGWSPIAVADTSPSGLGDLDPAHWYQIVHPDNRIGYRYLLYATFTPVGAPCDSSWIVALPNESIAP